MASGKDHAPLTSLCRSRVPAPGGSDDLTLASKPHFLGQYRKSGFENLDDELSGLAPRGGQHGLRTGISSPALALLL
jgi:hypothetical protein